MLIYELERTFYYEEGLVWDRRSLGFYTLSGLKKLMKKIVPIYKERFQNNKDAYKFRAKRIKVNE